jgi:hypothetical protein
MGAYEVTFSLFLRDDTPARVLDELHWHLGLSDQRPDTCVVGYDTPEMFPHEQTYLPGKEVAVLRRQFRYGQGETAHYAWGLHARLFWGDDQLAEVWWQLVGWLAAYADEDGYAGSFREELGEQPTLLLIRGGKPHVCGFGEQPKPLS